MKLWYQYHLQQDTANKLCWLGGIVEEGKYVTLKDEDSGRWLVKRRYLRSLPKEQVMKLPRAKFGSLID